MSHGPPPFPANVLFLYATTRCCRLLPMQSRAGMICTAYQGIRRYPTPCLFNLVDIDIDIQIQRANDVVIHQRLVDCGNAAPGLAALQFLELGDMW